MIIIQPVQIGGGYDSGYTYGYNSGYTDGYLSGYSYDPISGWVRNPEWLPIPSISDSEQVIYILVRVDSGDTKYNRYGFYISIDGGTITVDWGDGNMITSPIGDGTFLHDYNYENPNLGGLTSEGYKQALVKITCSNRITRFSASTKPDAWQHTIKILDYVNRLPYLNILTNAFIGGTVSGAYTLSYLERAIYLYEYSNIQLTQAFINAPFLKYLKVKITDPTDIVNSFQNLNSLTNLDNVDVSFTTELKATKQCSNMFNGCNSLKKIPDWFYNIIPTDLTNTFSSCYSIEEVKDMNTTKVQNFNSTFINCYNLRKIGNYDYSKSKSLYSTFSACYNLHQIGSGKTLNIHLNIGQTMELWTTFTYCYRLEEINITTGSTFSLVGGSVGSGIQMFYNCYKLKKVRCEIKPTRSDNFIYNCNNLESLDVDLSNTTQMGSFAVNNYNLKSIRLRNLNSGATNLATGLNFASSSLDRNALIALFNDLPVVSGTYTITITNSLGAPDLTSADRLIATSKGWTITG